MTRILLLDTDRTFITDVCRIARDVGVIAQTVDARLSSSFREVVGTAIGLIAAEEVFDIAERARSVNASLPILVTAISASSDLVNKCFTINASLVTKPLSTDAQVGLRHWMVHQTTDSQASRVGAYADANRLSQRQREILLLAAAGIDRAGISSHLGISLHTLKGHVSELLLRTGSRTFRSVLADAMAYQHAGARDRGAIDDNA